MKKVSQNPVMVKKIIVVFLLLLIFIFGNKIVVHAESTGVVSGKHFNNEIYLYVKNNGTISSGKIQIGTQQCENVSFASIRLSGIPIKTILMVDSTISMQKAYGENARSLMRQIIDNRIDGEQFKIVTYAEEPIDLTGFSTDYDAIKSVIDTFEYKSGDTYLSKALFETINNGILDEDASLYRIIMISDGVEDDKYPYATEEIAELIEKKSVLINMIGVETKNNSDILTGLFYYARKSNGKHNVVNSGTDTSSVVYDLMGDYDLNCIKIQPDAQLLDGSVKEVHLEIFYEDGSSIISNTSVRMPFGNNQLISDNNQEEDIKEGTDEGVEDEIDTVTVYNDEDEVQSSSLPEISLGGNDNEVKEENKKNPLIIVLIIVGAVLILVVMLSVIIIVSRNSKKKKTTTITEETKNNPKEENDNIPVKEEKNKTLTVSNEGNSPQKSKTLMLWDNSSKKLYLKFISRTEGADNYRVIFNDSVKIGRVQGDIVIDSDMAISSSHCEITKKGDLYYLKDLNSSNGTYYNGSLINQEVPIVSGGILKIGKSEFEIQFEEE